MGVLSSLLPGLRDLRAPLAAGYIWLVNLWLLFGDEIPSEAEAEGVIARLYRLGDLVSEFGTGLAISFVAYLIGTFSQSSSNGYMAVWRRFVRRGDARWKLRFSRGVRQYRMHLRRKLTQALDEAGMLHPTSRVSPTAIVQELSRHFGRTMFMRDPLDPDEGRDVLAPKFEFEPLVVDPLFDLSFAVDREVLRARLMADQEVLYGEFDRFQSESEFKSSISFPVAALSIIMAFLVHPAWSLMLAVVGWLWLQASRLEDKADLALVAGVSAEKIESPTQRGIEAAIAELRRRVEESPPSQPSPAVS
jgi:hypothetical protein